MNQAVIVIGWWFCELLKSGILTSQNTTLFYVYISDKVINGCEIDINPLLSYQS